MNSLNTKKKLLKEKLCDVYKKRKDTKKKELKDVQKVLDDCKRGSYKYGHTNLTLIELLEIIAKEEKNSVIDFIELFPFSGLKGGSTVNQSLIFEALWVIIFLCSFDNIRKSNFKRVFKKKLEDTASTPDDRDLVDKLNTTYVAESHKSGIADIYFEEVKIEEEKPGVKKNSKIMCNFIGDSKEYTQSGCSVEEEESTENETFLFSAKYLLNERGISGYDIAEIYNEAIHKIKNPRVVLLVKNSDDVKRKKARSKKLESNIVKDGDIYGINELNIFYNKLLENLITNHKKDVNKFIKEAKQRNNELDSGLNKINLRFHQKFIVNYTEDKIKLTGQNKFVWGAVPRSGKTFMIGGLISKMKPNNVIIFLGAVTETNKQFEEGLFDKFKGDFREYKIYSRHSNTKERTNFETINPRENNIVLISLQKGWQKGEIPTNLSTILKTHNKMVFFDESHQGGKGEEVGKMLNNYIFKPEYGKFPFIMVTATFATPLLRFGNENLWGEKSCLVQWSYEDIEYMKELDKEDAYESLLERLSLQNDGETRVSYFEKVLSEFEKNGVSKGHLADYFTREYPDLVVLCPSLENTDTIGNYNEPKTNFFNSEQIDIAKIFELKYLKSGEQFKNDKSVNNLLDFIWDEVYEKLLLNRFNYDVLRGKPHSQLWFLPTQLKTEQEEDSDSKGFIEQLQFLLAKKIIEKMGDDFCVLLMHGQHAKTFDRVPSRDIYKREFPGGKPESKYIDKYENFDTRFYMYNKSNEEKEHCLSTQCIKSKNIGLCIEEQQRCAYARNKSLIILTGARLRLGISMPCVDIALHMDPISNVDTIYQSMFRVLTGTDNKQRGYFVDLLKERMIKFVYQYNNYTNKLSKSRLDINAQKSNIQKRLFSWNFNGLNQFSGDSNYKNIYRSLVNAFALTDTSEFADNLERYQENSTVKQVLEELGIDVVKDIYRSLKKLGFTFKKGEKGKISIDLLSKSCNGRCGKPKEGSYECSCEAKCESDMAECCSDFKKSCLRIKSSKPPEPPESPEPPEPPASQEEDDEEEQPKEADMYNSVTEYIKTLFALFIIFYHDKEECRDLKDLERYMKKKITISDYNELCKQDKTLLECYLKFIIDSQNKTNEKDDIKISVINDFKEQFIKILINLEGKDIQKEELNKFYCFIFDKINIMKKNISSEGDKINERCSQRGGAKTDEKQFTESMNETVLETIRKYLNVREEEKKLFGEVFTPIELVCEMLDKLPMEVWKDPNLKWLDPANGIGNYPVVCYYKLMEGLKTVTGYEDEKTRSKHIIEQMLFMVELNPVNVKVCRKVFKMIDSDVTPNIYNKDFLLWSADEIKKDNKYDIIMGNPPYNDSKSKNNPVYQFFCLEGLKILNEGGFLTYVHPPGWKRIYNEEQKSKTGIIFHSFKDYYFKNIVLNLKQGPLKDKLKSFPEVDYYILEKSKKNETTGVITYFNDKKYESNVLIPKKLDFLPNFIDDISQSIFASLISKKGNKFSIKNPREVIINKTTKYPDEKKEDFKYPHYHFTKNGEKTFLFVTNDIKINDFEQPKIIMSFNYSPKVLNAWIDDKGNYGTTDFGMYQLITGLKIKPESLKYFLNSKIIKFILEVTQYASAPNTKNEYKILNLITIPEELKENPTDEDIYKYYGITKEEQQLIEEVVKDPPETRKSDRTKKASRVSANNANTTHTQKASTKAPPAPFEKPPSRNANTASKRTSGVNTNVNHTKKASNKTTLAVSASKPTNSSGQGKVVPKTVTIKKKRCPRGEKAAKLKDPQCPPNMIKYTFKTKECCRKE